MAILDPAGMDCENPWMISFPSTYEKWTSLNTKADYDKPDGKLSYQAHSISFQGYYDVPLRSMIRPFFNVGVGYYGSDIKGEPDVSTSSNKMAWNVGAGFSWAIGRREHPINLDIGYRYVRFGKEKYKDGNGNSVPIETEAHQVYLGYRYTFL